MAYKKRKKRKTIVEKILKKLTPKRIKKEIETIEKIKLPPDLQKWVKEYEKVRERDRFFWKWLYRANQLIVFPETTKKYQKSLRKTKTLFNMFLALLDDVADRTRNKKLLKELLKVPFESDYIKISHLNQKEGNYLKFAKKLWARIYKTIKAYPRHKDLKEIFEYDVAQMLNAMNYANLVNQDPYLINETEYWIYLSHNMQAIINLMMDLICSPKFNLKKIGLFREIAWESQKMARIGNWVSTWEREIIDKDFTSGVFVYAIQKGVVTPKELTQNRKTSSVMMRVKRFNLNIKKTLLKRWEKSYKKIGKLGKQANLKNVEIFQRRLEKLLFMHLSSQGYK